MPILNAFQLPYFWYFLAGLMVSLTTGAFLFGRGRTRSRIERLALFICPSVVYITLTLSALKVIQAPENDWEAARLAPTFALLSGSKLYVGPGGLGALMNTTFPPVAYLAYVPAGLFGRVTYAIIAGSCISLALYLAPTVVLSFWPRKDGAGDWPLLTRIVGLLLLMQAAITSKSLNHAAFSIHADAPMLAFSAFAALTLYLSRRDKPLSPRACLASTTCAALAVWSELSAAPLILILPIWVFATRSLRDALRYSLGLVLALLFSTLLFRTLFGVGSFKFSIIELPSKHPWIYQGPQFLDGLLLLSTEYFCCAVAFIASILLAVVARWGFTPAGKAGSAGSGENAIGVRRRLDENRWLLFVLIAFASVPVSLWTRLQIGGYLNNYAPTLYFLTIGLISLLLVLSPLTYGEENFRVFATVHRPSSNVQELAYRFSKRHPGEAYFPWNPLSNLLGEGRLYDFDCALYDRESTGYPATGLHVRRHLPETLRYVCFPPYLKVLGPQYEHTMKYLPDFTHQVEVPELAGWTCYERIQISERK